MKSNALKCPNCKLINPPNALRCDCGYEFMFNIINRNIETEPDSADSGARLQARMATKAQHSLPTEQASLQERYRKGYRLARWMVRAGTVVGVAGMIGGILFSFVTAGIGIPLACASAFISFVLGTAISGLGQLVMASIDTAVNTSPFISDTNKVRIMAL